MTKPTADSLIAKARTKSSASKLVLPPELKKQLLKIVAHNLQARQPERVELAAIFELCEAYGLRFGRTTWGHLRKQLENELAK